MRVGRGWIGGDTMTGGLGMLDDSRTEGGRVVVGGGGGFFIVITLSESLLCNEKERVKCLGGIGDRCGWCCSTVGSKPKA